MVAWLVSRSSARETSDTICSKRYGYCKFDLRSTEYCKRPSQAAPPSADAHRNDGTCIFDSVCRLSNPARWVTTTVRSTSTRVESDGAERTTSTRDSSRDSSVPYPGTVQYCTGTVDNFRNGRRPVTAGEERERDRGRERESESAGGSSTVGPLECVVSTVESLERAPVVAVGDRCAD